MVLNIVTGQIKQPHFLRQASRFYPLSLDGEPPQQIIGWTKMMKMQIAAFFSTKMIISASILIRKSRLGSKVKVRESIHVVLRLIQIIEIQNG